MAIRPCAAASLRHVNRDPQGQAGRAGRLPEGAAVRQWPAALGAVPGRVARRSRGVAAAQPAGGAQLAAWADELLPADYFHPQAAFVDGRLVGGSAMISFEVTVPGSRPVRLGGVTSTAVAATHRRRGLLRLMMQAMFDEARERGEPLAGLSASEGTIYGRFGYGPPGVPGGRSSAPRRGSAPRALVAAVLRSPTRRPRGRPGAPFMMPSARAAWVSSPRRRTNGPT